jgi:hypothetical protein
MDCVTVSYGQVKGRARQYRYWQPARYTIHTTHDGRRIWKYACHLGVARRSERLARQDARRYAVAEGVRYIEGVRHGRSTTQESEDARNILAAVDIAVYPLG